MKLARRRFQLFMDEMSGKLAPASKRRQPKKLPNDVGNAAKSFLAPQRERNAATSIRPQPFEVTEEKREERRKRAKVARKPPPRYPKRSRQPQGVNR